MFTSKLKPERSDRPLHFADKFPVQPKLKINDANDEQEREADAVADNVMMMPETTGEPPVGLMPSSVNPSIQLMPDSTQPPIQLMPQTMAPAIQLMPEMQENEMMGYEEEKVQMMQEEDEKEVQMKCEKCAEEEKGLIQKKPIIQRSGDGKTYASPALANRLNSMEGQGQSLPNKTQREMSGKMGADFSEVKIHTDDTAIKMSRELSAKAFTHGHDIYFNKGQYNPADNTGKHLLAHELTHSIQQSGRNQIQRVPTDTPNLNRLRELLQDDSESEAITLIGQLSNDEVIAMFDSREFKELAISAFNNEEMYRAMRAAGRDLYKNLEWMFDEGTSWEYVEVLINSVPSGRDRVRADNWMKEQFIGVCDNEEMAEAVDLLGGTLLQKLTWMKAEGSSWDLIEAKLLATADAAQKLALYASADMEEFFVSECNNEEMAEAVDLLGGTLLQKLTWMKVEGSSWELVKPKIIAAPQAERDVLKTNDWRDFFVSICTNVTMAEAVDTLNFDLKTKLEWMIAEGTSYDLVKPKILAAPAPEKAAVLADHTLLRAIQNEFNWNNFARTVELLGRNAPTGAAMIGNATVQAALATAWAASAAAITIWNRHDPLHPGHPCNPPPGAPPVPGVGHEEGGFIYMNLITGTFSSQAIAPGGQADLTLSNPAEVTDSIVVGGYHTHPNVGPCWGAPLASTDDIAWTVSNGVPLLLRGAFPVVATTSDVSTGAARLHLAGNRGVPGAAGGLAPQATKDGNYDEI